MPDIAILPATIGAQGDVAYVGADIVTDSGLETAVYLSLFTDAQDPDTGQGGYWGDSVDDQPSGSLLWTKARTVISPALPGELERICEDALQWLVDEGIAESIAVQATITGQFSVAIGITIVQNDVVNQFSYNWTAQRSNGF